MTIHNEKKRRKKMTKKTYEKLKSQNLKMFTPGIGFFYFFIFIFKFTCRKWAPTYFTKVKYWSPQLSIKIRRVAETWEVSVRKRNIKGKQRQTRPRKCNGRCEVRERSHITSSKFLRFCNFEGQKNMGYSKRWAI